MFDAQKFKFIREFQKFHDVLNVNSFEEYEKKLKEVEKQFGAETYRYVSGFSFEFIIGAIIHLFGAMPQIGIIDYQPTYVGDPENPDYGADGYGLAYAGADRQTTRRAVVQVKYRANKWASVSKWGQLPQQIRHELTRHDTVNLTVFTATNEFGKRGEAPILEHMTAEKIEEDSAKSVRNLYKIFTEDEYSRIVIRVIDFSQLQQIDSFMLWRMIRNLM